MYSWFSDYDKSPWIRFSHGYTCGLYRNLIVYDGAGGVSVSYISEIKTDQEILMWLSGQVRSDIWKNWERFGDVRIILTQNHLWFSLPINVGSFCLLGICRHASFLHGTVDLKLQTLPFYSFARLFIPAPGFHWWFLEGPQTSVVASSKGPFISDQDDSTRFAVLASAPEAVVAAAAAVIVFTLKADRNWLA